MSDVPGEILFEILSRLPVVPLLRFRCVSKSWKSLIDSKRFIRHHLNHSLNTNSNLNIILESRHLFYSTDFDLLNETNRVNFQELAHPLKTTRFGKTKIVGSCDGLLVLSNDEGRDTILWNPSVKRFHKLPYESFDYLDAVYIAYGLGYDVVSDDYKLVRMVQFNVDYSYFPDTEIKVYSLKSGTWKRIPDFPYYLKYRRIQGGFVNGALHWIVGRKVLSDTDDSLVIAFDLGTEEYRLVPLPQFAGANPFMDVFVLGGCVSLMFYSFYVSDNVDIWVMKEYGVQESWSMLFTFHISDNIKFMTPIAYSKCNRKMLVGLEDRVLMWCDLDKKSTDFSMVKMPRGDSHDLGTYPQSLVWF